MALALPVLLDILKHLSRLKSGGSFFGFIIARRLQKSIHALNVSSVKNAEQRTASLSLFWRVALPLFFVMAAFYNLPARYMWRTLLLSKAMEEGTEIVKGAGYIQPQLREAGREDLRNLKALPRQSRKRQGLRRFGRL